MAILFTQTGTQLTANSRGQYAPTLVDHADSNVLPLGEDIPPHSSASYQWGTHAEAIHQSQIFSWILAPLIIAGAAAQDPPIRPFVAGPQQIDLTLKAQVFHQQPAGVAAPLVVVRPIAWPAPQRIEHRAPLVFHQQPAEGPFLATNYEASREEFEQPRGRIWGYAFPVVAAQTPVLRTLIVLEELPRQAPSSIERTPLWSFQPPPNRPAVEAQQELPLQAPSWVRAPFPTPAVAPQDPVVRPVRVASQELPIQAPSWLHAPIPAEAAAAQNPVVRQWQVPQELPLQAPSEIWRLDIAAQIQRPVIRQWQVPQELPLQSPSSVRVVNIALALQRPIIRQLSGSPQADPTQIPPWIWRQQPEPFVPPPGDVRLAFSVALEDGVFEVSAEISTFSVRAEPDKYDV